MHTLRPFVLAALLLSAATPAFADATFFLGTNRTPTNRAVRGFSFGTGSMIAWEFEYASNGDEPEDEAPGLRTFMTNALLQTPFSVAGFQPYLTGGIGFYRETLDDDSLLTEHRETAFATAAGLGVKMSLFGPLRIRVDYRVVKLSGDPLHGSVQRVYSGLNLRF